MTPIFKVLNNKTDVVGGNKEEVRYELESITEKTVRFTNHILISSKCHSFDTGKFFGT